MLKQFYILVFLLFSFPISASSIWHCAHPELCQLLNEIIQENKVQNFEVKNVVQLVGDPHEYEPTSEEIKHLIKVNNLIIGPIELNPWISKIIFQRPKNQSFKQIELSLKKEDLDLYVSGSKESLSHFWLYPKIYCEFKKSLITNLIKSGVPVTQITKCENNATEENLKAVLKKIDFPIIVTHDALSPLLKTLSGNPEKIISLKGSGHHEEINSTSVKKLYQALENKKVLWIKEKNINLPPNIANKMRASDLIVELDTSSTKDKFPFSVLLELESKIKLIVNR